MSRWFLVCILEVAAAHTDFSHAARVMGRKLYAKNFLKNFWI